MEALEELIARVVAERGHLGNKDGRVSALYDGLLYLLRQQRLVKKPDLVAYAGPLTGRPDSARDGAQPIPSFQPKL